jgi:fimbrial chaperone protein
MKKIEGYVSKKAILYWLENYESLQAKDTPPDAIPGCSGPKAYDGVTSNQLNKLMLDQAIDRLPKLAKACCKARWVHRFSVNKTLKMLDIEKQVYYNRCKLAVNLIHKDINGERANYMALLGKIL